MWVPPRVSAEMVAERREHEAEVVEQQIALHSELERWNKALKQIDPYLELVRASDDATAAGLTPGYFHVLRHNPGAPPALFPVEGPNGEFREPDSKLFDDLAKSDMWSNRSLGEKRKRELEVQKEKARAREREEQERLDETVERWTAASRPQVLFSDVKGWTPKVRS